MRKLGVANAPTRGLLVALAAAAAVIAGCGGGGDDEQTKPASQADQKSSDESMDMDMDAKGAIGMISLSQETVGDVNVGLAAMDPEIFFISTGSKMKKHTPSKKNNVHLMATLSDTESDIRLPDAAVTLRVTDPDGKVAYDGPLYPMIGRGMGMHYGENMTLPKPGTYKALLVSSPPRIGRHRDSEGAWMEPVRVEQSFKWDGKTIPK